MRVLFFSPFAAIDKHERPLLGLKEILESEGHTTEVMRCDKTFQEYCISMSAFGLQFGSEKKLREDICNRCTKSRRSIDYYFDNKAHKLNAFFTNEDKEELIRLIVHVNSDNWWDFRIGGFDIGRIAAYEFYLHNKLNSREIPDKLWNEYLTHLEYTVLVYFAAQRFFASNRIDRVIVYNRLYSINKIFCLVAESFGAITYTIEASGFIDDLYSRFTAFKSDSTILDLNNSREWEIARFQPLSETQVEKVNNHFRSLFKAESPWVYSQPKSNKSKHEIRSRVRADFGSKVILLAMSSMDEIFAVDMIGISPKILLKSKYATFENQLDWINHVISIVRGESNLHLVIRIHPRELPNKRESVGSLHARDILTKLRDQELPANVYLNTPDDSLSLYDLLQISEVVLNGNSTSGLEAAFWGIPVVVHHPDLITTMPQDFAYVAKSRSEYKDVLIKAIELGKPNVELNIIYRWYNFRFASVSNEFISDSLKRKFAHTSLFFKLYARLQLPLLKLLKTYYFTHAKFAHTSQELVDLLVEAREGINLGERHEIYGNGKLETENDAILRSRSEFIGILEEPHSGNRK